MKKNYQSGFMLAEAFIVSAFILGVLVFMFIQINTIISSYYKSFSYNTISGLYITREVKEFLVDNHYASLKEKADLNGYVIVDDTYLNEVGKEMLKDSEIKTIVFSKQDMVLLKSDTSSGISNKLLAFTQSINSDSSFAYRLIVEFNNDTYSTIKI